MLVLYAGIGALTGVWLMITAGTNLGFAEAGFIVLVFVFGSAVTTVPTIALLNHGSEAGTAASLMGVANFGLASAMAFVYSRLSTSTTFDVGALIAICFSVSLLSVVFIVRPWTIPDLRKPIEESAH
jgi:DHA1 family bicyclomycin/chloramphenicol resistance-like MFS transporter